MDRRERWTNGQTGKMGKWTDGKDGQMDTNRWITEQTHRQKDRISDRQTNSQTHS